RTPGQDARTSVRRRFKGRAEPAIARAADAPGRHPELGATELLGWAVRATDRGEVAARGVFRGRVTWHPARGTTADVLVAAYCRRRRRAGALWPWLGAPVPGSGGTALRPTPIA